MNPSGGTKMRAKYESWKEALWDTVHRSTKPAKAIADDLGIHPTTLNKACEEDQLSENLSSKHLTALVQSADNLACLDYLEEKAGRVAFPIPKCTDALLGKQTADAIIEFGEWLREQGDAASDGVITSEEFGRIDARSIAVMSLIGAVRESFRQRVSDRRLKAVGENR
jgi:hypothetical protein